MYFIPFIIVYLFFFPFLFSALLYLPFEASFALLTLCFPSTDPFFAFSNVHLSNLCSQIASPKNSVFSL